MTLAKAKDMWVRSNGYAFLMQALAEGKAVLNNGHVEPVGNNDRVFVNVDFADVEQRVLAMLLV